MPIEETTMRPAAALFALPLLSTTPALAGELAANTGLWEMTSQVQMQGALLSPEMLAQIPPEARAQIEASMHSAQQPHTRRMCLTEEKLRRGFRFDQQRSGQCEQQVVSETSTLLEMRGVCHQETGDATMHARITLTGRDQMTGSFDMDSKSIVGPHHISGQISGKWISADCGSVGKDD
jgi:hypothetical protein